MSRREKLEQILANDPNDVFAHYAVAMEWLKEGRPDAALAGFDRALAIDPGYIAAYFQKGSMLLSIGRKDDARVALSAGVATANRLGESHAADEMQALLDQIDV